MEISDNILRIINNNLKVPAFVLDPYGELLTLNESARKLFPSDHSTNSYWNLLSPESLPAIRKSFNEAVSSSKSLIESTNIILQNNEKKRVDITFSGLGENGSRLILSTFDFIQNSQKLKLTVKADELKEVIKSNAVLSIIEEIRSSFPFTLLGKAKIRAEINKLEEFFWLKDTEGKYLLVNNNFAKNLGIKSSQLEGKYEKEFVPKYLSGFFDAVDEFIQNTTNLIIREGVTQPIFSEQHNLRIIEFPLCDLDNRAIAIIGIAQGTNTLDYQGNTDSGNEFNRILNVLNCPSAILNDRGEVVRSNQAYSNLYQSLSEKTEFDQVIASMCSRLSNSSDLMAVYKKNFEKDKLNFEFNCGKLYNCREEFESYLLQVIKYSEEIDTAILLNDRRKMYEIIMQTSPEPMYIYDIENLRFLEVNKSALDMYGYTRNEFLQMDLTDLYAPEDIQTLLDSGNKRSKEGVFTGPWRHKKRDGSSILVEISKVSFEYKESKAHFNIIRDVTEKLQLSKELQLYKSIVENTSEMVFITDSEGFIIYASNMVLTTLGYNKEELDTRPLITLVSDHIRSDISSVFYSSGKINSLSEIEFKKKDGTLIVADLIFNPVFDYDEEIVSYNVIAKRANSVTPADQQKTRQKENEITPANYNSIPAIDSALLSSMFHEILTPINVILGFVQEITENTQESNDEMKEASEIINQNRQVLLQTMDSVLEYSHILQKRIELVPERIFFTDILDNLQKNTKKTAETNKIEFSYGKISSSLNIETDVHRMESLLSIFITAAMKITKQKTVFISAYQYDDLHYIISIKDSRRSVSEYLAESLKQIFSNENKEIVKDYGVSKLSIHLARKLMKLLNGNFEMIDKSGEIIECGFIFPSLFTTEVREDSILAEPDKIETKIETILETKLEKTEDSPETVLDLLVPEEPLTSIPEEKELIEEQIPQKEIVSKPAEDKLKQVLLNEKLSKSSAKIELGVLNCLYVEDQIDSQILFKVQMKELKHIDFAVSFEAALPLLEQNKYDFIIMDINLQGEYNGLDALRIIRRLPGYVHTQIIAVTAYVLPGDKEKFIAAGFNDFISKPILREKLIDSLNKLLI